MSGERSDDIEIGGVEYRFAAIYDGEIEVWEISGKWRGR